MYVCLLKRLLWLLVDSGMQGEPGGRGPGWEEATMFRKEVVNVHTSRAGVVWVRGEM